MFNLLRISITSGVIMGTGDIICQKITSEHMDYQRTIRFALAGFTVHGPFWLYGFRLIDRIPLKSNLFISNFQKALGRSLLTQTLSPIYFPMLYTCIGWLEGISLLDIPSKKGPAIIQTLMTGIVFWPTVNIFNFMYIAPTHRVHYVTIMGVIWNTIISYINTRAQNVTLKN